MSTVASPMLRKVMDSILGTAKYWRNAGIVGDEKHQQRPSYHNSFNFCRSHFGRGYSTTLPDDSNPDNGLRNYAAALDISQRLGRNNKLKVVVGRLQHRAVTHPQSLIEAGITEFAGPDPNSRAVFAMSKGVDGKFHRTYGWDSGHRTHIHLSIDRKYANDPKLGHIGGYFVGA